MSMHRWRLQCDVGYHRIEPGDPCTPIRPIDPQEQNKPPENCNGYYTISRGYRKVAGNYCKGGAKYEPLLIACPYNKLWYFLKGVFYICGLLVLLGAMFVIFNNREEILYGVGSTLHSLKPNFSKIPESYLNIDNVDEDNTLFDNETAPVVGEDNNNKINENEEKESNININETNES